MREFAERFRFPKSLVFAFTWKGGPIHAALSPLDGIQIFGMTSRATHSKPSGQESDTTVTQDDLAVLLDFTANMLQAHANRRVLLIFDSISDIVTSLGFEKSYSFLKAQNELAGGGPMQPCSSWPSATRKTKGS